MNTKTLFSKFSSAIQWNSFFYVIYKVFSVALSFTLYRVLSTSMFSAWATVQSVIFLILLWLDCGFRKSIPRYCPEFSQNNSTHKSFIFLVLSIQSLVLILALPLLWLLLPRFIIHKTFIIYALIMFLIGGISELFRTIYHAHFWQKQFNLLQTVCMLTEMTCNFLYIWYVAPTSSGIQLVTFLLITKIASSFGIIIGSIALLPSLIKQTVYPKEKRIQKETLTRDFLEHSLVMWSTTCIKSLSERNFLFPFLTNAFGAVPANLFKVVHDGALFFQRIAIRVLGSADTALLSYALVSHNNAQNTYQKALVRLFRTVILMIIPLTCVTIGTFLFKARIANQEMVLLFFVVSLGYMLEVLLSPYERVLEVKRRYRLLWVSYTPYICGIILLFACPLSVSLVQWVISVHTLRLIGSLLMAYFASRLA